MGKAKTVETPIGAATPNAIHRRILVQSKPARPSDQSRYDLTVSARPNADQSSSVISQERASAPNPGKEPPNGSLRPQPQRRFRTVTSRQIAI